MFYTYFTFFLTKFRDISALIITHKSTIPKAPDPTFSTTRHFAKSMT